MTEWDWGLSLCGWYLCARDCYSKIHHDTYDGAEFWNLDGKMVKWYIGGRMVEW